VKVKKLEKTKNKFGNSKINSAVVATVLALLMLSSVFLLPNVLPVSAASTPFYKDGTVSTWAPGTNYGTDMSKYEWWQSSAGPSFTR
jgi:hypothetical protein